MNKHFKTLTFVPIMVFILLGRMNEGCPNVGLQGTFRLNCLNGSGYIKFIDSQLVEIEVNSNQIYIYSKYQTLKLNDREEIIFYYHEPSDLGRGGQSLSWSDYSKEIPIGKALIHSDNQLEFIWFGFFNEQLGKYDWDNKMDFFNSESFEYPFCLKRCN